MIPDRRYIHLPCRALAFVEVRLFRCDGHAVMIHRHYGGDGRPEWCCSHEATGYVCGRGVSPSAAFSDAKFKFRFYADRLDEFLALTPGPINHVPGYVHPTLNPSPGVKPGSYPAEADAGRTCGEKQPAPANPPAPAPEASAADSTPPAPASAARPLPSPSVSSVPSVVKNP